MTAKESTVPQKCYSCHAELTSPIVCEGCQTLYPLPTTVDYFGLLGLPRSYDIDLAQLEARFVAISRHVHPDYFTQAGEEMSRLATRLSAELNDAVTVLKDPVLRAGYLLETSGGPAATEDRTVPPEVLADAMELREEIEDAQGRHDQGQLDELRGGVRTKREALLETIATLARKLPGAGADDMRRLRHTLNAVKYYNNMLDLLWIE